MWLELKSNTSDPLNTEAAKVARIYLPDVSRSYGNGVHRFAQHACLRDVTTTNPAPGIFDVNFHTIKW